MHTLQNKEQNPSGPLTAIINQNNGVKSHKNHYLCTKRIFVALNMTISVIYLTTDGLFNWLNQVLTAILTPVKIQKIWVNCPW